MRLDWAFAWNNLITFYLSMGIHKCDIRNSQKVIEEVMAFLVIYETKSTTGIISPNEDCTQKTYKNDTWYDTDLISIKQHATTMTVAMIIMLTDNHCGTEAKLMNIICSQFSVAFLQSFLWQPCHDDCHQSDGNIFCAFFGNWTVIMEYCTFF